MNRAVSLGLLVLVAFGLGFFRASTADDLQGRSDDQWQPTPVPETNWQQDALDRLAANGRWNVKLEPVAEEGPTGEFSQDYRLVAVVESGTPYALLEPRHAELAHTDTILKVSVGDELLNDWTIADIQEAAVVAERKDESQRVELFPRK